MEKFTKFDDKKTGVNPFIPPPVDKLSVLVWLIKLIFILPMILIKLVLLIALYPPYMILHVAKYAVRTFCSNDIARMECINPTDGTCNRQNVLHRI